MLEFSKLTLNDIERIKTFFPYSNNRICNNTIGGVFIWRDFFSMEYAVCNDTVIFKAQARYSDIKTAFSVPLGIDVRGSIDRVIEYCRFNGIPIAFYGVTDKDIGLLRSIFDKYQLFTEADWDDYIYIARDLTDLEGRKYSSKRNHINHFKKAYKNYSFEVMTESNLPHVREFFIQLSSNQLLDSDTAVEDQAKTIEVLDNFDTYGFHGGLLRVDGNVVAFSAGEVNNDVLFVHIEKADMQYKGAYQVINNEFAKHFASDGVEYINREEDDGDEGLRFSKLSYHPYEILEKYIFVPLRTPEDP